MLLIARALRDTPKPLILRPKAVGTIKNKLHCPKLLQLARSRIDSPGAFFFPGPATLVGIEIPPF